MTNSIHPFPAKMASDIALAEISTLSKDDIFLDQMCGSGTSLRLASNQGATAFGFDLDPLAVLISSCWTTPINLEIFLALANQIVGNIKTSNIDPVLPWIDNDVETTNFINFWFDIRQIEILRRIAYQISIIDCEICYKNALQVTFSRMIITKNNGASLARDISHSRPHKTKNENDYDVLKGFLFESKKLAKVMSQMPPKGGVTVSNGDSRKLISLVDNSIDMILTSPPYLNAIDYIRGHKLALVWFGYSVENLRNLRKIIVGSESIKNINKSQTSELFIKHSDSNLELSESNKKMISKYYDDILLIMNETFRVLKPNGKAIFVIGNSKIKGIEIQNDEIVKQCGEKAGLITTGKYDRMIMKSRRYLPPPSDNNDSQLNKRMLKETVIHFAK